VIEFSQDGFRQWGEEGSTLCELGGTDTQAPSTW
jgi:salicylate 5-hydroxylase large subunit